MVLCRAGIIKAATETLASGDWIVKGPITEPSSDYDGESTNIREVWKGLKTFIEYGSIVDWEHGYQKYRRACYIVGKGVRLYDAPHPRTGVKVPWLDTQLYKAQPYAREAHQLLEAGGSLAYSIAGLAERDEKGNIGKTTIFTIGITGLPIQTKNVGCLSLVKALATYWDATDEEAEEFQLPVAEETWGDVGPILKALEATGQLPFLGPGVNALGVSDPSNRKRKHGKKRKQDLHLAVRLASALKGMEQHG